jgi:isochorismate hydrolase
LIAAARGTSNNQDMQNYFLYITPTRSKSIAGVQKAVENCKQQKVIIVLLASYQQQSFQKKMIATPI